MTTHSEPPPASDEHIELRFRLQEALGERYVVDGLLGEGGMAVVFRARDTRHKRSVAIKVLQEQLAHTIGLQRFLQEIEVIARLQHPNLLILLDSGDIGGLPFYVMPLVEGKSLRDLVLQEGRLSVDRALAITREIGEALRFAHENGVVHRDIKPSNVLLSAGHAVVADFGIATALRNASVERLTETGISLGSPTYMSPEQAAGERDLGPSTDIYSLACVLYEMLAGQPPIDGGSMQQIVTRKLTGMYEPLRERRPDVPRAVEMALQRALAIDPSQRFATMQDFLAAIAVAPAKGSRRSLGIAVAAGVIALLALALVVRNRGELEAAQKLAEVGRLARDGRYASAFALAAAMGSRAERDSTRKLYTFRATVRSTPAGARVYMRAIGGTDTAWSLLGVTPLDSVALPRGGWERGFLMRFEAPGHVTRFLLPFAFSAGSSYRGVPPLTEVVLQPEGVDTGMVQVPGFSTRVRGDSVHLRPFLIDKLEITNAEFGRFVQARGYERRELWTEPFVRDGRTLPWDEGIALLRDATGLPGPATWRNGTYAPGEEQYPVGGVSWYEAMAYARFAGKRLPSSAHYFRGALLHHRDAAHLYVPTSNLDARGTRPVGQGVVTPLGLHDAAGNVREWNVNPRGRGRLTRGGAFDDADFHVSHLIDRDAFDRSAGNGFRLVKLSDHDSVVLRLEGEIDATTQRDYTRERPVRDAEFTIFRRLYDYDRMPLASRVEEADSIPAYRWERVSFMGPAGHRMAAYLMLPREHRPPWQAVVLWPGSGVLWTPTFDPPSLEDRFGFLPLSGRALVLPILYGTYDRDDSAAVVSGHPPVGSARERDLTVLWHKELRRTVDYLQSRPDIDSTSIALYGHSWGGGEAPIALAVDGRFKAAVLKVGGLPPIGRKMPEVDPVNFAPRVRAPTLMLNGRHDVIYPHAQSQVPLYQLLGTPAGDKKHVVYAGGHAIPNSESARETLAWLDRYLGPPGARSRRAP